MFIIVVPNINHNSIDVKINGYFTNIDKSKSMLINDYYIYKIYSELTSGVSYKIKTNNGNINFISNYICSDNSNCILMYDYNYYDTGFAKIYHETEDYIIMMINNKVIDILME
jgi:hypothetical protein